MNAAQETVCDKYLIQIIMSLQLQQQLQSNPLLSTSQGERAAVCII